jgi:hypothetical protein
MGDVISKISSYNIFTNLIPGVVLAYAMDRLQIYSFSSLSAIVDLIVYYFLGMVMSRIGSIIIEPLLRAIGFLESIDYSQYIIAEGKDPKVAVLLESSNLYRSMCAVLVTTLLTYLVKMLAAHFEWSLRSIEIWAVVFISVLFFLSYRKQSSFIAKRVSHHNRG